MQQSSSSRLCKRVHRLRAPSGAAILVLILLMVAFVLVPICLFVLECGWICLCQQRQHNATEAAALAAARDVGQIVIEDPYFGLLGLSDHPAVTRGSAFRAGDGYPVRARSINGILAAIRLDMIIACMTKNKILFEFARQDLEKALRAKEQLTLAIKQSLHPDGSAKTAEGAIVRPYKSALQAYRNNVLAKGCDELNLQLGAVTGLTANVCVPEPEAYASVCARQAELKRYRACVNIPYAGCAFVFAAGEKQVRLADIKLFRERLPNLPYQNPSVIRVDVQASNRTILKESLLLKTAAAAVSQAICDPLLNPPALTINCPDGVIPDYTSLGQLLASNVVVRTTMLCTSSNSGDYPESCFVLDSPKRLPANECLARGVYDWLRANGTKLNIASVLSMFSSPLSPGIDADCSHMHVYQAHKNGIITLRVVRSSPERYVVLSDHQLFAVTDWALRSKRGFFYDMVLNDFMNFRSCRLGGIHSGEPLPRGDMPSESDDLTRLEFTPGPASNIESTAIAPDSDESLVLEQREPKRIDSCQWSGASGRWGYDTFKHFNPLTDPVPSSTQLARFEYGSDRTARICDANSQIAIASEITLRICQLGR